jgi:hypothetical protein
MDNHRHGEDGYIVYEAPDDTSPAVAEVEAVEVVAVADVEIAKVNAERDIALAKIGVKRDELWQEGRIAELEGELTGMREMLAKLMPEPEPAPAPVVVSAPAVFDDEPEIDEPPVVENKPPAQKKSKGISWF